MINIILLIDSPYYINKNILRIFLLYIILFHSLLLCSLVHEISSEIPFKWNQAKRWNILAKIKHNSKLSKFVSIICLVASIVIINLS